MRGLKKYRIEVNKRFAICFLATFLILSCIFFFINLTSLYRIPTNSMAPTINNGDLVIGIKPIVSKQRKPQSNEIWVFKKHTATLSSDTLFYIKRICAIPGDTIQIVDGKTYTNHNPNQYVSGNFNVLSMGTWSSPNPSIFPNDTSTVKWSALNFGPLWVPKQRGIIDIDYQTAIIYGRYIINESAELYQKNNKIFTTNGEEIKRYEFKQNYYFVCGDNLPFSEDSRHWGFIAEKEFVCKSKFVIPSIR